MNRGEKDRIVILSFFYALKYNFKTRKVEGKHECICKKESSKFTS